MQRRTPHSLTSTDKPCVFLYYTFVLVLPTQGAHGCSGGWRRGRGSAPFGHVSGPSSGGALGSRIRTGPCGGRFENQAGLSHSPSLWCWPSLLRRELRPRNPRESSSGLSLSISLSGCVYSSVCEVSIEVFSWTLILRSFFSLCVCSFLKT